MKEAEEVERRNAQLKM